MSNQARAFRTWCQDKCDDTFGSAGAALLREGLSFCAATQVQAVTAWSCLSCSDKTICWCCEKDQETREHLFCNTSLLGILHSALRRSICGWSVATKRHLYWGI